MTEKRNNMAKKKSKKKTDKKPELWKITRSGKEVTEVKMQWYTFARMECPSCGRIVESGRVAENFSAKCAICVSKAWAKVPEMTVLPSKGKKSQHKAVMAQIEVGIVMTEKKKASKKKRK